MAQTERDVGVDGVPLELSPQAARKIEAARRGRSRARAVTMHTMIDHIAITVSDLARSKRFYEQALAPLNCPLLAESPSAAGFGLPDGPTFWIRQGEATAPTRAPRVREPRPRHR